MSKYVIKKTKNKITKSRDEKVSLELAFETVYSIARQKERGIVWVGEMSGDYARGECPDPVQSICRTGPGSYQLRVVMSMSPYVDLVKY